MTVSHQSTDGRLSFGSQAQLTIRYYVIRRERASSSRSILSMGSAIPPFPFLLLASTATLAALVRGAAGQCPSLVDVEGSCSCRLKNFFTEIELYCENLGTIGEVPSFSGTGLALESVTFYRNTIIEQIQDDAFRNLAVRTLMLKELGVRRIADNAFRGLQRTLEELYLQSNLLEAVPSEALKPLNRLKYLGLEGNRIVAIEDDAFSGLRSLSLLYVANNQIASVSRRAFHGLGELIRLSLNENELTSISGQLFNTNTALVELSVRGNRISSIDAEAFRSLTNLDRLDLSNNSLGHLADNLFEANVGLHYLNLASNELSSLPPLLFGSNSRLAFLDLSDNRLTAVPSSVLKEAGAVEELRLNNNRLTKFDWSLLGHFRKLRNLYLGHNLLGSAVMVVPDTMLSYLDLSHNQLCELPDGWLGELKVYRLDVSYNRLETVSALAFRGSYYLDMLRLSHNNLTDLPPQVLNDAFALSALYLDNNRLRSADLRIVESLTYLSALDVSHNLIADLSGRLFDRMAYLETLDLSYNRLTRVRSADFGGLRSLQFLYMDNNNASVTLTHDFFENTPNLHTIGFQSNRIDAVEKYAFYGLKKLVHLDLSHNRLSYLSEMSLYYAKSIRSVNLTGNCLTSLSKYYFKDTPHLSIFDVSHNLIRAVSVQTFVDGRSLTDVRIGHNPYHCSCDFSQVISLPFISDAADVRCQLPKAYADAPIASFLCHYCLIGDFCRVTEAGQTTGMPAAGAVTSSYHVVDNSSTTAFFTTTIAVTESRYSTRTSPSPSSSSSLSSSSATDQSSLWSSTLLLYPDLTDSVSFSDLLTAYPGLSSASIHESTPLWSSQSTSVDYATVMTSFTSVSVLSTSIPLAVMSTPQDAYLATASLPFEASFMEFISTMPLSPTAEPSSPSDVVVPPFTSEYVHYSHDVTPPTYQTEIPSFVDITSSYSTSWSPGVDISTHSPVSSQSSNNSEREFETDSGIHVSAPSSPMNSVISSEILNGFLIESSYLSLYRSTVSQFESIVEMTPPFIYTDFSHGFETQSPFVTSFASDSLKPTPFAETETISDLKETKSYDTMQSSFLSEYHGELETTPTSVLPCCILTPEITAPTVVSEFEAFEPSFVTEVQPSIFSSVILELQDSSTLTPAIETEINPSPAIQQTGSWSELEESSSLFPPPVPSKPTDIDETIIALTLSRWQSSSELIESKSVDSYVDPTFIEIESDSGVNPSSLWKYSERSHSLSEPDVDTVYIMPSSVQLEVETSSVTVYTSSVTEHQQNFATIHGSELPESQTGSIIESSAVITQPVEQPDYYPTSIELKDTAVFQTTTPVKSLQSSDVTSPIPVSEVASTRPDSSPLVQNQTPAIPSSLSPSQLEHETNPNESPSSEYTEIGFGFLTSSAPLGAERETSVVPSSTAPDFQSIFDILPSSVFGEFEESSIDSSSADRRNITTSKISESVDTALTDKTFVTTIMSSTVTDYDVKPSSVLEEPESSHVLTSPLATNQPPATSDAIGASLVLEDSLTSTSMELLSSTDQFRDTGGTKSSLTWSDTGNDVDDTSTFNDHPLATDTIHVTWPSPNSTTDGEYLTPGPSPARPPETSYSGLYPSSTEPWFSGQLPTDSTYEVTLSDSPSSSAFSVTKQMARLLPDNSSSDLRQSSSNIYRTEEVTMEGTPATVTRTEHTFQSKINAVPSVSGTLTAPMESFQAMVTSESPLSSRKEDPEQVTADSGTWTTVMDAVTSAEGGEGVVSPMKAESSDHHEHDVNTKTQDNGRFLTEADAEQRTYVGSDYTTLSSADELRRVFESEDDTTTFRSSQSRHTSINPVQETTTSQPTTLSSVFGRYTKDLTLATGGGEEISSEQIKRRKQDEPFTLIKLITSSMRTDAEDTEEINS